MPVILQSDYKVCRKCGATKLIGSFEKKNTCRGGYSHRCINCASSYKLAWAHRTGQNQRRKAYFDTYNKTAIANERKKKWKLENPEKNAAINRQWRQSNPEKQCQYAKNYAKKYPHRVNERNARRRLFEKAAMPQWADKKKIRAIYKQAENMTKDTGIKYQVDHIIPLRGKTVCGLHVESNLQILTINENSRKRISFDEASLQCR